MTVGEVEMSDGRYDDPCSPGPWGRTLRCLHCSKEFLEDDAIYEDRHGLGKMWYCPDKTCDGAGVGFDLIDTADPGLTAR